MTKYSKTWKYTTRKIRGENRKVKIKKLSNGKYKIRVVSHRNTTD